ncbi:MAG: ECF transporter S component [Lentihominibacter sp.]|jgi:riboflavin transporter FmnP
MTELNNTINEAAAADAAEVKEEQKSKAKMTTIRLAKMGMLVAISVVLVALVHFPIFPAVPFLEYDPADIPILLGTFAFGPIAGVMLTVVTSVIQGVTVSAASGIYGILMHIIATSALVITAGVIYKRNKTKKRAIIGLISGVVAMTVVMIGANLIVTPLFMGVPVSVVWDLMPFIAGFNAIKAGINGLVTFLVYKRISAFLHR